MRGLVNLGLFTLSLSVGYADAKPMRPNIVLIMADDLGIEGLGCYGGQSYQTPHLDRMASEGMRFTHAYAQPLCTPTRLQIMTGKYNHRNWQCFGVLPRGKKTFGHMMQDFGYKTVIAGKWQLTSYDPPDFVNAQRRRGTGTHPKDAGFDEYHLFHAEDTEDKGSRYANPTYLRNGALFKNVQNAYGEDLNVTFILDFMKRHRQQEMFVYYPMALPHSPVVATPDSEDWADPNKRLVEDNKYFGDMVAYMDKLVGRLVAGITELGLCDNTLVLFYSDNGTNTGILSQFNGKAVRGGKACVTQAGIRVPLIAYWPAKIMPALNNHLIDASDFLPTLAALAGRQVPKGWFCDGLSFAPTLLSESSSKREWVFFWYDPRPGWDKERFSRHIFALDQQYKLFSDGRLFDIREEDFTEQFIPPRQYTDDMKQAKRKLEIAIAAVMAGPQSAAALQEVDAGGEPIP